MALILILMELLSFELSRLRQYFALLGKAFV